MGSTIKFKLLEYCQNFLSQRIETLETAISDSRISSQQDSKSSAGDKYETSREMIQGEITQNSRQLEEAQKLINTIEQLKQTDPGSGTVVVGSLVKTDRGFFYIGIPIGMVDLEKQQYAIISSSSPIGQVLMGKKKGDQFSFQNRPITIERIE